MQRHVLLTASALVFSSVISSALSSAAWAAPGGDIGTMPTGHYACELPGEPTGPAARRITEQDFRVTGASSYQADGATGSYLLTGTSFVMTSGPRNGDRYLRQSEGFLRKIGPDGTPSLLRCIKRNPNND